jgi:hypothetical protein
VINFTEICKTLRILLLGKVDWELIYAFLRCRGFVCDGEVPVDRRFTATWDILGEDLSHRIGNGMEVLEQVEWLTQPMLPIQDLLNANRLNLPDGGRRHDEDGAFPDGNWDLDVRTAIVLELARKGKLDLSHSQSQLRFDVAALRQDRGRQFQEQLQRANPDYLSQSRDELLAACRDYLQDWHTGRDLLLNADACAFSKDTIDFYKDLFRLDFLGGTLEREVFGDAEWPREVDQVEVNLPIAAVVGAIDRLQSETHRLNNPDDVFTGGPSLVTSTNTSMALSIPVQTGVPPVGGPASRPRRSLLLPVFFGDELAKEIARHRQHTGLPAMAPRPGGGGHHFLAQVQEDRMEDPARTEFLTTLYDSSRHVFGDMEDFVAQKILRATKNLQWSTHRNAASRINFEDDTENNVPQQQRGQGWQCGPHTVINAWILAMGLRISPKADYTTDIYRDFRTLARAAVMDCSTGGHW